MYTEAAKALPREKYGRLDPGNSLELKAKLQLDFWLPIAEMLDPWDHRSQAGGGIQDFYSRGRCISQSQEIQKSYALMKGYLGTPQLAFSTWVQLRPIFQTLLADALTEGDMDMVACAVREYVRIELGEAPDPQYGCLEPIETPQRDLRNTDDKTWYGDPGEEWDPIHSSDIDRFRYTSHMHNCFNNPEEFDKQFPGKSEHRLNMARALEPIFERDWFGFWPVIERAFHCAKLLLAIRFRGSQLNFAGQAGLSAPKIGGEEILIPA